MAVNKLENIKRINKLWGPVYPYLASMIMDDFGKNTGHVLELGPFSGGLSIELAKLYADLDMTISTWEPDEAKYIEKEVADSGLISRIEVVQIDHDEFSFADDYFNLIICRGALFFLGERLLLESFRVLAKNGLAFIGGGYGRNTPQHVIDNIHNESHLLNQNLGKRWITKGNLENLLRVTKLTKYCHIEEEGGVWLIIRK